MIYRADSGGQGNSYAAIGLLRLTAPRSGFGVRLFSVSEKPAPENLEAVSCCCSGKRPALADASVHQGLFRPRDEAVYERKHGRAPELRVRRQGEHARPLLLRGVPQAHWGRRPDDIFDAIRAAKRKATPIRRAFAFDDTGKPEPKPTSGAGRTALSQQTVQH